MRDLLMRAQICRRRHRQGVNNPSHSSCCSCWTQSLHSSRHWRLRAAGTPEAGIRPWRLYLEPLAVLAHSLRWPESEEADDVSRVRFVRRCRPPRISGIGKPAVWKHRRSRNKRLELIISRVMLLHLRATADNATALKELLHDLRLGIQGNEPCRALGGVVFIRWSLALVHVERLRYCGMPSQTVGARQVHLMQRLLPAYGARSHSSVLELKFMDKTVKQRLAIGPRESASPNSRSDLCLVHTKH